MTLAKLVLVCYKHKIVIIQSTKTAKQKRRTYKELLEQVNKVKAISKVVAICKLTLKDIVLIIDNKQACTS